MSRFRMNRRSWLRCLAGAGALVGLDALFTAERTDAAAVGPNDSIKVTRIDAFVLKNSWVFVKISTDAGIVGWGEMLKDDAKACAAGALEVSDEPMRVITEWIRDSAARKAVVRAGKNTLSAHRGTSARTAALVLGILAV